jgi:hypothetical protein
MAPSCSGLALDQPVERGGRVRAERGLRPSERAGGFARGPRRADAPRVLDDP